VLRLEVERRLRLFLRSCLRAASARTHAANLSASVPLLVLLARRHPQTNSSSSCTNSPLSPYLLLSSNGCHVHRSERYCVVLLLLRLSFPPTHTQANSDRHVCQRGL
jgi:hypothetical protein